MLFLLQYHRRAGKLVRLERFATSQRMEASQAMLDLEIELRHQGVNHEVVILEAASEEALRKTHGRYFADLDELLEDLQQAVSSAVSCSSVERAQRSAEYRPQRPEQGTKLKVTTSGIVKEVCGVCLRSRPHVNHQP
jgi:hypothetical protein